MIGLTLLLAIATSPPALPKVRIETSAGTMIAELAIDRAPISACNFLRYVAAGDYDRGSFFRTVRGARDRPGTVPIHVIQASARYGEEYARFAPIAVERTQQTGLTHRAGALSMARWGPDTATSSFSIVVRDSPEMDFGGARQPDGQGFAVFGRIVRGMMVVSKIAAGRATDERLEKPVVIRKIALLQLLPARCG
jgi:peptidyl-prolyl cis-trans isomerase A (cyclophilin A)